jgi:hypothetical protein
MVGGPWQKRRVTARQFGPVAIVTRAGRQDSPRVNGADELYVNDWTLSVSWGHERPVGWCGIDRCH